MIDILTLSNQVAKVNRSTFVERAHSGCMVALFVPDEIASQIVLPGGEKADELHVTLAYLGEAADWSEEKRIKLRGIVSRFADSCTSMAGEINSLARFCNTGSENGKDAFVLVPDMPDLPAKRSRLLSELEYTSDFEAAKNHGYVPHITLAYIDKGEPMPYDRVKTPIPVSFDTITLAIAGDQYHFPLRQKGEMVERAGARHRAGEYKALARIAELVQQLGGMTAFEAKAGQRHSRRDQEMIQEIHDLATTELGAMCKDPYAARALQVMRMTPPLLELSQTITLIERGQADAPNYRPANSIRTCNNCEHSARIKGSEYCDLYEFEHGTDYVCDDWAARRIENETPGLSQRAALVAQIIKRGGPTSGNFGHKSVKGKHGGSKPGGGLPPNKQPEASPDSPRAARFTWQDGDVKVNPGVSIPKRLEATVRSVRKQPTDANKARLLKSLVDDGKIVSQDVTYLFATKALTRPMKEITFEG